MGSHRSRHPKPPLYGRDRSVANSKYRAGNVRPPCGKLRQALVWAIPITGFVTAGLIAPFFLASTNTFKVSMLLQNAQMQIEDTLDFRPPPLDGSIWPGGDLSPNPQMLLQTWRYNGSHRSGRDPRLAPLTCRLYHVCQFADGSLLLPEAMRPVERSIRSCGITDYVYARQTSPTTQFDHSHAMFDLVAPHVPPGDDDPEGQLLHASQIIFGQHISAEEWSSETVDYRRYNGTGILEDNRGEFGKRTAKPLTPLLYSRDSTQENSSSDFDGRPVRNTWESSVLSRLQKSLDGFDMHNFEDAFPGYRPDSKGDSSSSKNPLAVCYHSIMSTGEKGDELPRRMMGPATQFFKQNKILRNTRWLLPSNETTNQGVSIAKEDKSIELNPRRATAIRDDDGFLNVLFIRDRLSKVDIDEIIDGLTSRLKALSQDSKQPLTLSATTVNATSDVELMFDYFQATDVVVGAQGGALNNILYMRARSLVVEVVPYSAPNDVYSRICDTLSISYIGFMAIADEKRFEQCVQKLEGQRETAVGAVPSLMKIWTKMAHEFNHGERRSVVDLRSSRSEWRQTIPGAATCARHQKRLKLVSTEPILRAVFDRAIIPRLQ